MEQLNDARAQLYGRVLKIVDLKNTQSVTLDETFVYCKARL